MNSHTFEISSPPGAFVHDDGVSYRVWAPDHAEVIVRVQRGAGATEDLPMARTDHGYFELHDARGRAGDRYGFMLGGATDVLPDPASRFQPEGVHKLSECVDSRGFRWECDRWQRPGWRGQSTYELHVGTFTDEGTFRAAIEKLPHLAALGVGAIELMPVADFPGKRNWGYDGVALFAPARCYGRPDDLRALVDAAHEHGLAVVLDVVYNHFGPDGNYLTRFARDYFREDRHTPWGAALNFAAYDSRPVREFFLANAAYWFDEFRFDGLRLDATHAIIDESEHTLLEEIAALAHERGAFAIAEDERNSCELVETTDGRGARFDGIWADDFNHQIRARLLGGDSPLTASFSGNAADLARTIQRGWFYEGAPFPFWKNRPRGAPAAHLAASAFVYCIENHDQAGNRALGERLGHLVEPAVYRAASALLGLTPHPPLLFMGQEWAASSPFCFFTDHHGELGKLVTEGRKREFPRHAAANDVPDPQAPGTFEKSKLNWEEIGEPAHARTLALYRGVLGRRNLWLGPEATRPGRWKVGAIGDAVVIRYAAAENQPELLVVSALTAGARIDLDEDPLVAPAAACAWQIEFDSNAENFSAPPASELPEVETLVFSQPATLVLVAKEAGDSARERGRLARTSIKAGQRPALPG